MPCWVERRVVVPTGMSRRVRGPLLEIWESSPLPGCTSAPAEPKARGSGWKQGNTRALASNFCPLRPSFSHLTHAVTPGRVHSSLFIHVVLTRLEEQNFLQKYLGRKPDKESVLSKKQIFCVEGGTRVCLGHTSVTAPRDLPAMQLCLPTEAHSLSCSQPCLPPKMTTAPAKPHPPPAS